MRTYMQKIQELFVYRINDAYKFIKNCKPNE